MSKTQEDSLVWASATAAATACDAAPGQQLRHMRYDSCCITTSAFGCCHLAVSCMALQLKLHLLVVGAGQLRNRPTTKDLHIRTAASASPAAGSSVAPAAGRQ